MQSTSYKLVHFSGVNSLIDGVPPGVQRLCGGVENDDLVPELGVETGAAFVFLAAGDVAAVPSPANSVIAYAAIRRELTPPSASSSS